MIKIQDQDSFSGLDDVEFERSGRRLGPNQGLIFQTTSGWFSN